MVVLRNGGKLGHPDAFCFYCGRAVWKTRGNPNMPDCLTKDHVIPRSKGGRKGPTVPACHCCNRDKSALSFDEYRVVAAYRAGLIPKPDYKFAAEQLPA
jgi:hypothetical protein